MTNYYQEDPEAFDDNLSELRIIVDRNGEITFNCNWDSTPEGINAISAVFFGLAYNDLADKILNHLKAQCVLEDNEEDFVSIVEAIKMLILQNEREIAANQQDDSLVVTPRDITRL